MSMDDPDFCDGFPAPPVAVRAFTAWWDGIRNDVEDLDSLGLGEAAAETAAAAVEAVWPEARGDATI